MPEHEKHEQGKDRFPLRPPQVAAPLVDGENDRQIANQDEELEGDPGKED